MKLWLVVIILLSGCISDNDSSSDSDSIVIIPEPVPEPEPTEPPLVQCNCEPDAPVDLANIPRCGQVPGALEVECEVTY